MVELYKNNYLINRIPLIKSLRLIDDLIIFNSQDSWLTKESLLVQTFKV